MYYLNDKHNKYEYAVFIQVGNARPYINDLKGISNMEDIYRRVEEIEKRHNHYKQRFYIDNEFYNNKYSLETGGTYYKFLKRPVADWEDLDENIIEKEDNIYYFNFYKNFSR